MLINILGWFALAFLCAVQLVARGREGAFGTWLYYCVASFGRCALLTPAIAIVATRFRFSEGEKLRSSLAHIGGAAMFVVVGGALMGIAEQFSGARSEPSYVTAALFGIRFYVASDIVIYVGVVVLLQAILYATNRAADKSTKQPCRDSWQKRDCTC